MPLISVPKKNKEIYNFKFSSPNVEFIARYQLQLPAKHTKEPQYEYFFIYRTEPFVVSNFGTVERVLFGVSPSYPGVYFKIPSYYDSTRGLVVESQALSDEYHAMKTNQNQQLAVFLQTNESTADLNNLYNPQKLLQDHIKKTKETVRNLPEFIRLQKYARYLESKWFAPEANMKGKKLSEILNSFPSDESVKLLLDLTDERANQSIASTSYGSTALNQSTSDELLKVLVKPRMRFFTCMNASKSSLTTTFNLLMDLKKSMYRNELFEELQDNSVATISGMNLK